MFDSLFILPTIRNVSDENSNTGHFTGGGANGVIRCFEKGSLSLFISINLLDNEMLSVQGSLNVFPRLFIIPVHAHILKNVLPHFEIHPVNRVHGIPVVPVECEVFELTIQCKDNILGTLHDGLHL